MIKKNKKPEKNEVRFIPIESIEMRADADGESRVVIGMAAPYEVQANLGYFKETFARGAFKTSIDEKRDVFALFHHDFKNVLGRTGAGTLTLSDRADGVFYELDMPETSIGNDLLVSIRRKDIGGVSVSWPYSTVKDEWNHTVDPPERRIIEAELIEMSITAIPAYTDTTLAKRSLELSRNESPAGHSASEERNQTPTPSLQVLRLRAARLK